MFSRGAVFLAIFLHGMEQSSAIQEKIICEARSSTITCTDTPCSILNITYANYGRTSLDHCSDNDANNTDCRLANSTAMVREICQQKATCTLNVTHYIFDDPCPGFSKYLEVQFECISTETCSTTDTPSQTALSTAAPTTNSVLFTSSLITTTHTKHSDTTGTQPPSSYSSVFKVISQSRSASLTTTTTQFATDKLSVSMKVGISDYATMPSSKLSLVSTAFQSALLGSTTASIRSSCDFYNCPRHVAMVLTVTGVVIIGIKSELH